MDSSDLYSVVGEICKNIILIKKIYRYGKNLTVNFLKFTLDEVNLFYDTAILVQLKLLAFICKMTIVPWFLTFLLGFAPAISINFISAN